MTQDKISRMLSSEFGVGVDIVRIDRFQNLDYHNDENFLKKIFTENELLYCFSKHYPSQHLAARFAGKEAVIKALSNNNYSTPSYNQIEILNNKDGSPFVKILDNNFSKTHIKLSLSHSEDSAIAFSTIYGNLS